MSTIINFNAQVAPMEHVEKVVRQEQEHSQIKQQTLLQNASQLLARDNQQVHRGTPGKKGRRVEERNPDSRGGHAGYAPGQQRAAQASEESAPAADTPDFSAGVWAGNIVNVKV